MNRLLGLGAVALMSAASPAFADNFGFSVTDTNFCGIDAGTVNLIQFQLSSAVSSGNGGFFTPNRMWSAIVDRQGVICSVARVGDAWPGSRAIAIAKAASANDFSSNAFALSTAMLYGPTQPGGSLYGLNNSNPFNPAYLAQGSLGLAQFAGPGAYGPKVPGGIITFGGGVPLYRNGQVIGGLGVSGDSSCADHAIAYQMRARAGHFGPLWFGLNDDNIAYFPTNASGLPVVDPRQFAQPHCIFNASNVPTDVKPATDGPAAH